MCTAVVYGPVYSIPLSLWSLFGAPSLSCCFATYQPLTPIFAPFSSLFGLGGRTVRQWEAHDKRIWAVDFCPLDATTYATGSDDGTVKVSVEPLQIAHSTSCMIAFCTACGRAWIALSLLQL